MVYKVDRERYLMSEKVRNWVLRLNYEQGIPVWMGSYRAAKKFGVSLSYVNSALYQWKKWYYDNGVRHRPMELFIEEDKQKRKEKQ